MTTPTLHTQHRLGPLELPNRLVMAPMTRNRAGAGQVPTELMARYYEQRASGGLIVTEASQVAPEGVGYPNTPGIHTPEQVAGWRRVTERVHACDGRIFLQLWHVGRISHPLFQPGGKLPVAPSAVAPAGDIYTPQGMKPYVAPRALETDEIAPIVEQFAQGARNARDAEKYEYPCHRGQQIQGVCNEQPDDVDAQRVAQHDSEREVECERQQPGRQQRHRFQLRSSLHADSALRH
jgi:N-ethylmaleimide reductase